MQPLGGRVLPKEPAEKHAESWELGVCRGRHNILVHFQADKVPTGVGGLASTEGIAVGQKSHGPKSGLGFQLVLAGAVLSIH